MKSEHNLEFLASEEGELEEAADLEEYKSEKKKINCKPIMWGMLGTITLYFLYIIYRIFGSYL
ncbi:MAG: hypothetical protein KID00_14515 [Clostridium argentinense]|uniref:Uncharacterized protein n=1 Tax=Clostridium faecium TaxID=2762223 RepID=A0ABR8YQZ6_9CLOT|nr:MULTISPECIES: hypothetical protein [Clostridium]MBD8046678.1 hypothetical protein [Clostridium faecium]MBS5825036.1 hypothetical protein [Clostridium argentinense]MDU1350082.1 hypothetical protein [Clostridium argentinense]